ncbi:hypothetical protein [Noviherbaspirillum sp.]
MKKLFIAVAAIALIGCSTFGSSKSGQSGKPTSTIDDTYRGGGR